MVEGSEAVDGSFTERLRTRWFPVCRGGDAVPRHIVHTALLGQELAVWRADDGTVNAWENRCPHRGVRLSVGTNLGHALKCRYHGWTYESGSARCIAIPCHPRLTPAAAIRVRAYPCMERRGHVWVRLAEEDDGDGGVEAGANGTSGVNGTGSANGESREDGASGAGRTEGPGGANRADRTGEPGGARGVGEAGEPDGVNDAVIPPTGADGRAEPDPTLRSVYVDAPAAAVAAAFTHYEDAAAGPVRMEMDAADPWTVRVLGGRDGDLLFMLQPLSERATVIHGLLAAWAPRIAPVSESAAVSASALASPPRHPPSSAFASAPASAGGPAFTRDRLAVLRRHDAALGAVRDAAEKQARP